jgi:hypothetical protein
VYIIYGDDASYGDRIRSGQDGVFEFKYLRPGKYTVYVYSDKKQTTSDQSPTEAIKQVIEITGKKQTIDAGKFTVKR